MHGAVQPTGNGVVEWHELYVRVLLARPSRPIRFRGVFTDGGCDERLLQYWVRAWTLAATRAAVVISVIAPEILLDPVVITWSSFLGHAGVVLGLPSRS